MVPVENIDPWFDIQPLIEYSYLTYLNSVPDTGFLITYDYIKKVWPASASGDQEEWLCKTSSPPYLPGYPRK